MTFVERKMAAINSGSALCLATLGPIFIVLNLLGGHYSLALINVSSSLLGLVCLGLVRKGFYRVSSILLVVCSSFLFSLSGYLFHNAMEYIVLIAMLGTVFMVESNRLRLLLVVTLGAAFFVVTMMLFNASVPGTISTARYGINLAIFLVIYYWILEIFRTINNNHQQEIERKNADLALSQQRLDREHEELTALTGKLQVANMAKEKLFSIVSHDLRSPLGNIRTTIGFLRDGHLGPEEFRAMLGELKDEVDHASDCLDTLLTWSASQLQAIQPIFVEVSLAAVAHDCVALLSDGATRKKITFENTIPAEARVWADKDQLSAILRNLISNALKFTPVGGVVRLTAREREDGWKVTVSDTGIGMSEERVRQLFDPYHASSTFGTANEKGLGLGLQICREFVQSHRGTLCVESREGSGSSFYFTLPAVEEKGEADHLVSSAAS